MLLRTCLVIFSSTIPAVAQMSGDYTVDPAGTGSRNYKSITAALVDLSKQGMAGRVTFVIESGTYLGFDVVPIKGMSATMPLTLKSKVKHGASVGLVKTLFASAAQPVSGLKLKGLVIAGFHALTPTTDIEIANCKIADIKASAVRWEIHHCEGTSDSAINLSECDDVSIHHVRWTRSKTGPAITIESTSTGSGSKPTRIYNNVIVGGATYFDRGAIYLGATAFGVEIAHNSVLNTSSSSSSTCLAVATSSWARPHSIIGNVFAVLSYQKDKTSTMELGGFNAFSYQSDGNIFFRPSSQGPIVRANGLNYATLAAWQSASGMDKSSIAANPLFLSNTDLHLRPGTPAAGKAVGTPSYVSDDFDGRKRPSSATIGAYEYFAPTTFIGFGKGCAGTGGFVPSLGHSGDVKIGSTNFAITLGHAKGGLFVNAFLAIGASNKTWNGVPLPLNLGGSCNLLAAPHLVLTRSVTGPAGSGTGSASIVTGIPNNWDLKGSQIHFQWGVVDSAAAGIGLAFSNGATLTF